MEKINQSNLPYSFVISHPPVPSMFVVGIKIKLPEKIPKTIHFRLFIFYIFFFPL